MKQSPNRNYAWPTVARLGILGLTMNMPLTFVADQARAQGGAIAASTLASDLSDNISKDLKSVIGQLESSASVVSFGVRSDLIVVADNLRIMGQGLVGKTFGELSQQQKTFFENARALATDAKSGINLTADRVEGVLASMSEAMVRIPGMDGRPFITKYTPSFVLIGKTRYSVSISGTLVGNGSPVLTFDKTVCPIKTKTERALEFDCPAAIFTSKESWSSGLLRVTASKSWWKFWGEESSYDYNVSIRAIPDAMGDYVLVAKGSQAVNNVKRRTASHGHRNNHCEGDQPKTWTFTPESGCTVDIQSLVLQRGSISDRSAVDSPSSVTSSGFRVSGIARNSGHCAPRVLGQRAFVDARGSVNFSVAWNDNCPTQQEVEAKPETGTLQWSVEKAFQMPANTTSFILTVAQADGKKRVVNGTTSTGWFDVAFDPSSKTVLFRPKPLESAMR